MAYSEAQGRATQKYQSANLEQVRFWVKKGEKDLYKSHAAAQGKSLNAYIVELIEKDMQRSESGSAAAAQLPKEKQAP